MQSCQRQHQTHQTNPTRADLDTHHMQCQDQAMQEGETWRTVKKRHDRRTLVKVLLVHSPRLQRAAGHVQGLRRLALGDPLGAQLAIAFPQVHALKASPALVAIMLATVLGLDYCCHRLPPLPKSLPCAKWRAKDGEVAPWLQS